MSWTKLATSLARTSPRSLRPLHLNQLLNPKSLEKPTRFSSPFSTESFPEKEDDQLISNSKSLPPIHSRKSLLSSKKTKKLTGLDGSSIREPFLNQEDGQGNSSNSQPSSSPSPTPKSTQEPPSSESFPTQDYQEGTGDNSFPVMYREVLQYLDLAPGSTVIDMTFGSGGHSTKILESVPDVKVLALDRDPVAFERAQELAKKYPGQVVPLLGKFSELPDLLRQQEMVANSVDAFLFDLGCSTMQLEDPNRGFSVSKTGLLDMRMDGSRFPDNPTAADVLENMDELDLTRVLRIYGGEKRAKGIARAIIETRYNYRTFETTKDLMNAVESLAGSHAVDNSSEQGHTATKTFYAMRVFVNNELNEANYGLVLAQTYLKRKGRVVTLAHTALEDTVVKQHVTGRINDSFNSALALKYSNYDSVFEKNDMEKSTVAPWRMMHKHVLTPTEDELEMNGDSRRVKMRALEKS